MEFPTARIGELKVAGALEPLFPDGASGSPGASVLSRSS